MSGSKIDSDDDDIDEDIIEDGTDSKMSEDEIKESVYADGKKLGGQKNVDKGLSKMRMAIGSEESIR